jgi:hypothetical protein
MAVGFPVKVDYETGDVLTADNMSSLSGTVNLLESAQYAAGKNKIINGDFGINQRAFTSVTTTATFIFDRFQTRIGGDGTATFTPQVFTPGAAPQAGYEATNFLQIVTASQTNNAVITQLRQHIEDVRTFAGQTATISFWAKAASGTPKVSISLIQAFGSGGSTNVATAATGVTLTTSFARYSVTIAVPSVSGKTIGTSSFLQVRFGVSAGSDNAADFAVTGIQNNTFSFWGIQLEAASTASPFQTATGTIQGELAACQRYCFRIQGQSGVSMGIGSGYANSTTAFRSTIRVPVTMRTTPVFTSSNVGGSNAFHTIVGSTQVYSDSLAANLLGVDGNGLTQTTSGITTGQGGEIFIDPGKTTSFLEWSAEL